MSVNRRLAKISHPSERLHQIDTALPLSDAGIQYFNVAKRWIKPRPRRVLESAEFVCSAEHNKAVDAIREAARRGDDLNPYYSKSLKKAAYQDGLLNDWGIHHFHLGEKLAKDGFIERTGLLLFVRVTDDCCYLLTILEHGDWTDRRLLEIVHTNWPESISKYRLKGFTAVSPVSDEDLGDLRKAGVTTVLTMQDGTIYMPPGGGFMTSGAGADAVFRYQHTHNVLVDQEEWMKANGDKLVAAARRMGVELPVEFELELVFESGGPRHSVKGVTSIAFAFVLRGNQYIPVILRKGGGVLPVVSPDRS